MTDSAVPSTEPLAGGAVGQPSSKHSADGTELPTIEQVLDRCGFGSFQIVLMTIVLCQSITAGCLMTSVSFIFEALKEEWGLGDAAIGLQAGSIFVGFMFGALTVGIFGDVLGRRPAFLLSMLMVLIGGFCVTLAPYFAIFVTGRMLTGFGVGGAACAKNALSLECAPPIHRSAMNCTIGIAFPLGVALNACIAWAFMPPDGRPANEHSVWRSYVAVSYSMVPVILIAAYFYLPESPRYLAACGKREELDELARRIAHVNDCPDVVPEGGVSASEQEAPGKLTCDQASALLLGGGNAQITVPLWVSWAVTGYIYYGFIYGLPQLFDELRANTYLIAAAGAFIEIPGTLMVMLAVEWPPLGRKLTGRLLTAATALFCLAAGFEMPLAGFVTLVLLARMMVGGMFQFVYLYTMELYPTTYRSFGLGASMAASRVGAMITPLTSCALAKWDWNASPLDAKAAMMWSFGIMSVAALVSFVVINVETLGTALQDNGSRCIDQGVQAVDRECEYNQVSTDETIPVEKHNEIQ